VTETAAPSPPRLPELLAPAGDWDCARAAVENGADAIYFGLDRFNARMRAQNFTEADLPALMEFLHRRGVRGYVTFNTLVFTDELTDAEDYLHSVISAGVDAAIVQDVGICRLIRKISPDFPIHGSTQLTVTSPAGVEFARSLGCELVVLARENSIREIEAIPQGAYAVNAAAFFRQIRSSGIEADTITGFERAFEPESNGIGSHGGDLAQIDAPLFAEAGMGQFLIVDAPKPSCVKPAAEGHFQFVAGLGRGFGRC